MARLPRPLFGRIPTVMAGLASFRRAGRQRYRVAQRPENDGSGDGNALRLAAKTYLAAVTVAASGALVAALPDTGPLDGPCGARPGNG